ncbi:MAG: bifunctional 5,10-methylenetetrahydrofolate dehydrogenase/5,10-methenyltetrahydrofolate cyclohydrolase [bacterium]|nr:bifunctional 5,10-methylenetetrahydrofolate dehydrogenase/5,10-methenyltetrahydrofolate cyclohydrolase [bacterium]
MIIFDGKKLASKILDSIKKETALWPQKPTVAVVSFGVKEDNSSYIIQKRKTAESLGFGFKDYNYSKESFSKAREYLNKIVKMEDVSAVVVQMPLPAEINVSILNVIPPEKDPDLLCDKSVGAFFNGHSLVNPPTAEAIIDILKEENISLLGKKVALFGYGRLVGRFLVPMLIKEGATVAIIDKNTSKDNAKLISLSSDIVISAVGEANIIKSDMVKDGSVVIDAGFSILDGNIVGDVDLDSVKDKISLITPVPGGVGPITVARLFSNVAKLFKYSTKFKN